MYDSHSVTTLYIANQRATINPVTNTIGDAIIHSTVPIAVIPAIIGGIANHKAIIPVVRARTHPVIRIISALSFGFCAIHSDIGVRILVIVVVRTVIVGINVDQIVCCNAKVAASCRATAPAYPLAYLVASQTWNFVSAKIP